MYGFVHFITTNTRGNLESQLSTYMTNPFTWFRTFALTRQSIHTSTCNNDIYIYIYIFKYIFIHMYICMYFNICIHIYIYIYLFYINIHMGN